MDGRTIVELKVADLRKELEKRNKDKTGVKQVLIDRLKEALEEDGHDPLHFRFMGGSEELKVESDVLESPSLNGNSCNIEKVESPLSKENKTESCGSLHDEVSNTDLSEQKKLSEETVPYVVQVGEQEEDLDYDLKGDTNGVHEEISNNTQKTSQSLSNENCKLDYQVPQESSKASQVIDSNRRNIWVSNLPKNVKAVDLKQHFSKAGKVISATVVISTRTPGGCFGFLQMATAEDAANAALKFNSTEYAGSILSVEATERKPPTQSSKPIDVSIGTPRTKHPVDSSDLRRVQARSSAREFARGRALIEARRRARLQQLAARRNALKRIQEKNKLRPREAYRSTAKSLSTSVRKASYLISASKQRIARETTLRSNQLRLSRRLGLLERPKSNHRSEISLRSPPPPPPLRRSLPKQRSSLRSRRSYNTTPLSSRYPTLRTEVPEPRRIFSPEAGITGGRHQNLRQHSSQRIHPRRSEPVYRLSPERSSRTWSRPIPEEHRHFTQPQAVPRCHTSPHRARYSRQSLNNVERQPQRSPYHERIRPEIAERVNTYNHTPRFVPDSPRRVPASPRQSFDYADRFKSPYDNDRVPENHSSSLRSSSFAKSRMEETKRDYRALSRSPPRSRDFTMMNPYQNISPEIDRHRPRASFRDRSPISNHAGQNRPQIVEYGHRSEPRTNWSDERRQRVNTVPQGQNHSWKPNSHSFAMSPNYNGRGTARRY